MTTLPVPPAPVTPAVTTALTTVAPVAPPVAAPAVSVPSDAPPGARYDHLARTPGRRWYHAPAALTVFLAGFVVVAVLVVVIVIVLALSVGVPMDADGILLDDAWATAEGLLFIAVALPLVLLVVRFVERRPSGTLASVTGRLRTRWLGLCLLPAIAVSVGTAVVLEIAVPTTEPFVGWSAFVGVTAVALALTPFQAAAEEFVFRGWIVQTVGAVVRSPWPGVLISAVLFALVHDRAAGNAWGFADLVIFAVLLALVTVRTGGLEAAIAMHVVHNSTISVLAAAYGLMSSSADYSMVGPEAVVISAVTLGIYSAAVLVMARRRGIATRSAG